MLKCILGILIGYLLGSVNMAIILTKGVYKDDVRTHGSGNAGATNVARTFGWGAGIATFVADFLKCILSYWIGGLLFGTTGAALAVIACVTGHCFPIYFNFKGGKAVSVGAAVGLLISWKFFLLLAVIFFSIALTTKYVSLSSISCAAALILFSAFFSHNPFIIAMAVYTGAMAIFMHRSNIQRLLKGQESKFHPGTRKK